MPGEILKLCSLKMKRSYLRIKKIATEFNEYFGQIVDSLELYDYPCDNIGRLVYDIDRILAEIYISFY